jgi:large repetitive protein
MADVTSQGVLSAVARKNAGGDAFAAAVTADSPVAWWRLDETSGTALADQQGTYGLTATGTYTLNQAGLIGSNAAIDFNGGYADRTGGPDLTTALTIEFVCKIDAIAGVPNWASLISYGTSSANTWSLYRTSSTNELSLGMSANSTWTTGFSGIADGTSHHVVVTFGSGTGELWIDGVSQGTDAGTANTNNTGHTLRIGASRDASPVSAEGVYDEVVLYDSVLSDARIGVHFSATGL